MKHLIFVGNARRVIPVALLACLLAGCRSGFVRDDHDTQRVLFELASDAETARTQYYEDHKVVISDPEQLKRLVMSSLEQAKEYERPHRRGSQMQDYLPILRESRLRIVPIHAPDGHNSDLIEISYQGGKWIAGDGKPLEL